MWLGRTFANRKHTLDSQSIKKWGEKLIYFSKQATKNVEKESEKRLQTPFTNAIQTPKSLFISTYKYHFFTIFMGCVK